MDPGFGVSGVGSGLGNGGGVVDPGFSGPAVGGPAVVDGPGIVRGPSGRHFKTTKTHTAFSLLQR